MKRLSSRYIATETGISMAANLVIAIVSTLIRSNVGTGSAIGIFAVLRDASPFLVMSAAMSALIPVFLTIRRHRHDGLVPLPDSNMPSLGRIALVTFVLTTTSLLIGWPLALWGLSKIGSGHFGADAIMIFEAVYGIVIAGLVTPAALISLFGWHHRAAVGVP